MPARRRFITAEHYRLHQLFPDELSDVNRSYTGLLVPEIEQGVELGLLTSTDVDADAWYVTELVMAVYHHFSYATKEETAEQLAERVWRFSVRGLGGTPESPRARRRTKSPTSPSGPPTS